MASIWVERPRSIRSSLLEPHPDDAENIGDFLFRGHRYASLLGPEQPAVGLSDTNENIWSPEIEALYGLGPGEFEGGYEGWLKLLHPDDRDKAKADVTKSLETGGYFSEVRVIWPDGSIHKVIHPDDRGRTLACWELACADKGDYDLEYRIRRHDGEYHWFKTRGVPIRDGDGKIVYWFGTCTDIEDMRRLTESLGEADRRKDEFLATLAHELRNPLAPIRNSLEVLRLSEGDHETFEQARTMMDRQLGQLVRLVDDLMDVSRINHGKLELRAENLNLEAAISSALETSRSVIEEMGHEVIIQMPKEPIFVKADPVRLSQIFMNLLTNSAKYSNHGSHIWVTVERDQNDVLISIRDEGIGLAPEHLPHIFQLFSQIDRSLAKSQGGLGIGLSLVKRLTEMQGGSIEAKSEGVGKGSEFIVHLPVLKDLKSSQVPEREDIADHRSDLRILVVDDNRDSADSLSMLLRTIGNKTRTAYDGAQAIEVTQEFRPDVILLDIGLPIYSGYEVCRRIRRLPGGQQIVIIAQTGWGAKEDRERTREAGFDQHLVKPIDPQALMRLLGAMAVPNAIQNQDL